MPDPQPVSQPTPQPAPPQPVPASAPPAEPPAASPAASPALAKPEAHVAASSPSSDDRLEHSVDDAYTLLDFACRRGKALPAHLSEVVINSRRKLESQTPLSGEEEVAFWDALSQLTKQVKPVTVESVKFSTFYFNQQENKKKRGFVGRIIKPAGPAEFILRRYLLWAMATLLVLLGLQMQWAIGTFIYNDAYKVRNDLIEAERDQKAALQESDNVKGTPAAQEADLKLAEANALVELDKSWSDVSFVRLWWWNRGSTRFIPPYDLAIQDESGDTKSKVEGESGVDLDIIGEQRLEYTRTELTLQVLSNYLLVTLFALLGGLTQALRSLSQQIQNVSLTDNDLYRVRTRVILGVISGVCMAWVYIISTTNANTSPHSPLSAISFLGSFTPWAIAFISGYSVEIFFALLERIINIATSKINTLDAPTPPIMESDGDKEPAPTKKTEEKTGEKTGEKPTPAPTPPPAPAPVG